MADSSTAYCYAKLKAINLPAHRGIKRESSLSKLSLLLTSGVALRQILRLDQPFKLAVAASKVRPFLNLEFDAS